jgi:hypothetical protein
MASVPDSTGDVRQLDLQCAKHDVVAPFDHGEIQRGERRRVDLAGSASRLPSSGPACELPP